MKQYKAVTVSIMSLILGIMMCAQGVRSSEGNSDQQLLDRQVATHLSGLTTTDALVRVLSVAGVPGGVVRKSRCDAPPKYRLSPAGSSLRDALEAIVSNDPQYKWQIEDGVVNLLYRNTNPTFLNLRIARFNAKNVRTVNEALDLLLRTPEVQNGVARLHIGTQLFRGGLGYYGLPSGNRGDNNQKFTVDLKNVTLREALNAIARAHGRAIWAYTQGDCNGRKFFSLDFSPN